MAEIVELKAPDIAPYRKGNTGIPYATTFRAREAGPHVAVNALVHGNELCGAIALDFLFKLGVRPKRGALTLSFANIAAYERFDPENPTASRFVDEDFNRVWSPDVLEGPRNSVELRRAREMRPLFDGIDLMLDIHSMQRLSAPIALCGPTEKGRALGLAMKVPANVVSDRGHKAGVRLRDYAGFGDPASPKCAALVECGQHWTAPTADMAIQSALRFLLATGAIDAAIAAPHLEAATPPQRVIEVTHAVTIANEPFVFMAPYQGLEIIPKAGTLIAHDGPAEIRTPYDNCILIMPSMRLSKGLTAVRLGRIIG
ncbi:MAG: succinylglutamate desuccinylase/aspartoacylase family protein [Alphaproteobacteria bacterium]